MEDHELVRYGITELFSCAEAHGLMVLRLSIPDQDVPASPAQVDELLDAMAGHEAAGGRLVMSSHSFVGDPGIDGTTAWCASWRGNLVR
jgi:hypothetical protein